MTFEWFARTVPANGGETGSLDQSLVHRSSAVRQYGSRHQDTAGNHGEEPRGDASPPHGPGHVQGTVRPARQAGAAPERSDRRPPRVAVVGAGAAGLAAAYTLRGQGIDVTLFEASDRAGGRMAGEVVDGGFYVDSGACIFHETQEAVNRLSRELGVSFERSPRDHTGTVYIRGKARNLNMERRLALVNLQALLSFDLFSFRELVEVGRLARTLGRRRADLNQKDHTRLLDLDTGENIFEFVRRNAGEEVARGAFLESFFNVGTLARPERMGALQGIMILWDFVFGYPDQATRNPDRCVADFSIALADACRDDTRLATPVELIVIKDGVTRGVETGDGFFESDAVICATTASAALRITPDMPDSIREPLEKVTYSSCCHVAFGVNGQPLPKPTYVFTFIPRTDSFISAFFDATMASPLSAPPGQGLIHAYAAEEHTDELIALSDAEIGRRFIDEIRRYAPEMPEEPLFTRVHRWKEAVFLAPGGVMTELHDLRTRGFPGVAGLALAGDYMNIMGVNGALQSGMAAAAQAAETLASRPGAA